MVFNKICLSLLHQNKTAMNINIIEAPRPSVKSFTMFAKPDLGLLKQTKKVTCSIHRIGKTRVSVDMQIGNYCVKINSPVDGFKQFEKTEFNHFFGGYSTSHYFIVSKKQNFEVFKEYVKELVKIAMQKLCVELDELTVELECSSL